MVWKGLWRVHIQYLYLFLRHVRPSPKGQPSHSAEQGTAWIRETPGLLIAGLILGLQCQQRGMNTNINNNLSVKYKSGVLNGFSLREIRRTYTWLGCPNQQSWGQDSFRSKVYWLYPDQATHAGCSLHTPSIYNVRALRCIALGPMHWKAQESRTHLIPGLTELSRTSLLLDQWSHAAWLLQLLM